MSDRARDGDGWASSEAEVLASARERLAEGRTAVLATVIDVAGSAYRRPGAKMLVTDDGGVGHVTAGCLEDEIERLAASVRAEGDPRVERYDLMPEADDDVWGLGVGCNGVVDLLVEPVDEGYRRALDPLAAGDDVGVLTVVGRADDGGEGDDRGGESDDGTTGDDGDAPPVGARAYYDPATGTFDRDDAFPAALADRLRDAVATVIDRGGADTVDVDGIAVFVDGIAAPDDLLVCGTGNDVRPIVDAGRRAGFRTTVVGFRGANATAERFPAADAVVSTSPARLRETDGVDLDGSTYVVVATHNFVDDRLAVDELLASSVPYVGLMGPRERFEEMVEEFETEGRTFSPAELDRLYTPVGLDLGAGTPAGIAVSVIGEVLAVANGREPRHLREREGPIHERSDLAADGAGGDGGDDGGDDGDATDS